MSRSGSRPSGVESGIARRLLGLAIGRGGVEAVLGDIEEGLVAGNSRGWFWRQVLGGVARGAGRRAARAPAVLAHDLTHGARRALRRRAFSALVIGILAVGLGATALVFSVVNGVLLQPLPYPEPERLVVVRTDLPIPGRTIPASSGPELLDLHESIGAFESMGGLWYRPGALTDEGADPEDIHMLFMSSGLMETLGVAPKLGRIPMAQEDLPGAVPVIVLSEPLWERRYGGDPTIIDRQVEFDGVAHTVVGVMPADLRLHMPTDVGAPREVDAWVPAASNYAELPRGWRILTVVGRLAPEATLDQARGELRALAARLRDTHGDHYAASGLVLRPEPLAEDFVAHVRPLLLILMGAVALMLAIVCANVANLYLSRLGETERELAVRTALGASRAQLLRQLVAESAVIVAVGAGLGMLAARQGLRALPAWMPPTVPRLGDVVLDGSVLAIMALVAAGCAALFGCLPLLQRRETAAMLRDGVRSSGGRGAARARRGLVVVEIALCLTLVVGVGLLSKSFAGLARVDPGFEPAGVVTAKLSLVDSNYSYREPEKIAGFYRSLVQELSASSGIDVLGATTLLPLDGGSVDLAPYAFETEEGETDWGSRSADLRTVTPGWLEAMGARRVAGRTFTWADTADSALVTIVDTTLAEAAWPGDDAIGKRLKIELFRNAERTDAWAEVVGVVDHIYQTPGRRGPEQIFVAHAQAPMRTMALAMRADRDLASLAAAVADTALSIDGDQPVQPAVPLSDYFAAAVSPVRVALVLLGSFAVVAVGLALVGVYGVIAFGVARRRREIGIQMAIGATPASVVRAVLGEGLAMSLIGVVIGLVGAAGLTRFLGSLLFGVTPTDPLTFAVGAVLLTTVAGVAAWLPARHAARLEPSLALRAE